MTEAAATFLLEKVTQALSYYVDLAKNAKDELEQLQNELGQLKSFLKEIGHRTKKEEPLREMERQIRKVVYEVEDIVDSCLTRELAEKKPFWRRHKTKNRFSLAEEVKKAREKKVRPMLDKARIDFAKMPFADRSAADQLREKGKKLQLIREDNVVGLKDQEETIINYLMEEKDKLDVISIIGMAGLGKTTLAWKIFKNKKIEFEYPTRIWVYVSEDFNMKEVLLKIIKVFTQQDKSDQSEADLIPEVRAYLENARFLLVMDDVWNEETWDAIKYVLPKNNAMGKVVITSRERRASVRLNHMLRFLTSDESWELLQYEVFEKLNNGLDRELERIGKQIAHQCDGLPLALVVMGGILLDHLDEENPAATTNAWESIAENVSAYIGSHDRLQRVKKMVELSYNKLPDEQRDCFLYVGVFPEDYSIPTRTLIYLWIAEGFVQQKEGQTLEETAETTLNDLINRNLLMVDKTNHSGQVKKCRVHDVIREFCKSKAAIEELNMYQEIKLSKGAFHPPVSEIQNHRRLCIHSELSKFLSENFKEQQRARSFLCFNDERIDLPDNCISIIPQNFNLLRVLDSKSFKFSKFPTKVTTLIHLRYLTLSCHTFTVLPEEISTLWNLQTLLVDTKSPTLEVKANIWKMFELRHIKTNVAVRLYMVRPAEGKAGENLQTLSRLSPQNCTEDVFNRACNLKRLGIRGDVSLLLKANPSLENLKFLEKLKLENDRFREASENPRGLPQSNFFPTNMKKLTLSATYLDWSHMSTLAKIGTLRALKLKDNAFTGKTWKADGGGFSHLQFLLISHTNLVFWEVSTGHFPVLNCLVLRNCERLTEIPLDLAKGLKKLDVDHVPKSAVKKIEEMKAMQEKQQSGRGGLELRIGLKCK